MRTDTIDSMSDTYSVREDGKNGTVHIEGSALVRTISKRIGRDDVLTVPLRSVTGVFHDRKSLGTDVVRVVVGSTEYEWKVKDAAPFVAALNAAVAGV